MNEKNDDIAHPDIVSKPLQTSDYWPNSIIRHRQGLAQLSGGSRALKEVFVSEPDIQDIQKYCDLMEELKRMMSVVNFFRHQSDTRG
jgi:hypothetical protein